MLRPVFGGRLVHWQSFSAWTWRVSPARVEIWIGRLYIGWIRSEKVDRHG